jgi:hypothetical protein
VSLFTTYLDLVGAAIPSHYYVGFQPPPELMPNVPFHFPINGGWPLSPDWFSELILLPFVSAQAALCEPSYVDLQAKGFVVPMLRTVTDRDIDEHHQRTPPLPASLPKTGASTSQPPPSAQKVDSLSVPNAASTAAPNPAHVTDSASHMAALMTQQMATMAANFCQQMEAMQEQLCCFEAVYTNCEH